MCGISVDLGLATGGYSAEVEDSFGGRDAFCCNAPVGGSSDDLCDAVSYNACLNGACREMSGVYPTSHGGPNWDLVCTDLCTPASGVDLWTSGEMSATCRVASWGMQVGRSPPWHFGQVVDLGGDSATHGSAFGGDASFAWAFVGGGWCKWPVVSAMPTYQATPVG